jgi:hypothetical protein
MSEFRFDYVLPVRRGQKQCRHDAIGSVVKLNQHAEPLLSARPERQARAAKNAYDKSVEREPIHVTDR